MRRPAGRERPAVARGGRQQDLAAVAGRAEAGHGVHRDSDVAGVGERRPAAVDAGADAHADAVGPGARAQAALDRERGFERCGGTNEDGEELVGTRVDLATACAVHATADDGADVREQRCIAIAEPMQQARRAFDVGQQERDVSRRQGPHLARLRLDPAAQPIVLDRQADRRGHRPQQRPALQHRGGMHEGGHRLAVALEQRGQRRGRRVARGRGQRHGLAVAIEIGAGRLGPVQHRERRVVQRRAHAAFELGGSPGLHELDDETTRRGFARARLELPGDEADRHDAVLARSDEQLLARALARRFVLECDLVEARQRVANVRLVVDRQPPAALRVDVSEGACGQLRALARIERAHGDRISARAISSPSSRVSSRRDGRCARRYQ